LKYITNFRVGHSEMGPHGRMKIVNVVNRIQDAAGEHADKLGLGVRDLLSKGYTWVVHRYRFVFFRFPECGQKVTLRTWYRPERNLYSLRNFLMEDENGEKLVYAESSWVVLDLERGRPVRLASAMPPSYEQNISRDVSVEFSEIPRLETPQREKTFAVRLHDLDMNRHVNNARYIEWAVETLPQDFLEEHVPLKAEALFKTAAGYGDKIHSMAKRLDGESLTCLHRLQNEGKQDCALVKTEWKPTEFTNGR